ncbi:MAG: hypothetical protein DRI37_08435 [Chloroflexi bacterium]|nr:MAG: hypothetical protein DRI37_08435 [Chloroflexota bacterium]
MRKKTETIAWIVLTLAFISCVLLAIGVPWGINWYLHNATHALEVVLQPRAGVVAYQEKGVGLPNLIDVEQKVISRSRIALKSDDAEALLLFYVPERSETPVSTLQLYGETDIVFVSAHTPRFTASELPHQISLQVDTSKELRVSVGGGDRNASLHIQTPQGEFDLEEGSYTLIVEPERTELIVNKGRALLPAPGKDDTFVMSDSQQVELTADGLGEIRTTEGRREIVRDGDFEQPLERHWKVYMIAKEYNDQDDGTVTREGEERTSVRFERAGRGHIETGIVQELGQDVQDINSLYVTAQLKVDSQSIPTCGEYGTECPIMLCITYLDTQGGGHEWLQGFYTLAGGGYPTVCPISTCESHPQHIQIPQGAWYTYTSPDLIPLLRERGIEPATLLNLSIYASGHSFVSAVDEVSVQIEK